MEGGAGGPLTPQFREDLAVSKQMAPHGQGALDEAST